MTQEPKDRPPNEFFGSMRGSIVIPEGFDLTQPALTEEELDAIDASIEELARLIREGPSAPP